MSKDVAEVVARHMGGKMNCAQAVLSVYGKHFGLPEEIAVKVAVGLGGGMGCMGKTCGAVTGAFLVLGLTYEMNQPDSRNEIYALVREFTAKFKARHDSISCSELLGYDMSTTEGMNAIREKKLTSIICPKLDQSAAEILEEMLAGYLDRRGPKINQTVRQAL